MSLGLSSVLLLFIAHFVGVGAEVALRAKNTNDALMRVQALTHIIRRDFQQRVEEREPVLDLGEGGGAWQRMRFGFFLRVSPKEQYIESPVGDLCFVVYFTEYSPEWKSMELRRILYTSDRVRELRRQSYSFSLLVNQASGGNLVSREIVQFLIEEEGQELELSVVLAAPGLSQRISKEDWGRSDSLLGDPDEVERNESLYRGRLRLKR